ncbi:MAG: AmmeMemoRadiSam system protein B [Thermoplasmata archaeon]|nr:AmmeMemoRadiSam system protein B [Thermoplasmata archaeon]
MRMPAAANRFYSADEEEVRSDIEACFRSGPGLPGVRGDSKLKAVVVPHAGYIFSGACAAYAFKEMAGSHRPEAYIVIGPDHYGNGYAVSMCTEEYWTPFGPCETAWEVASALAKDIPDVPAAHAREHSIEVELPFLKYVDPDARIVPIIMGDQRRPAAERLASVIREATEGMDVMVIASSDLVHYVPKPYADEMDARFLETVERMDVGAMYSLVRSERLTVCGYGPIAVAAMATSPDRCRILCQTDSSAAGYDSESVVGYGSAIMF